MINAQHYFNGQLADFDNEEVIAATFQVNRLNEMESREGDKTTTLTLPFSNPNKKIFQNAELVSSVDEAPYRRATYRAIVEGVEVFRGFATLEQSKEGYEVTAFSGNTDFFDELADKKLEDLDLSDLDHTRNDATVSGSWNNTEGYIYAFADYGKYKDIAPNADSLGEVIPEDLYPAMYLHTMIKRISDGANYTLEGEVLTNPKFLKQLVPFSNFPLTPDNTNAFQGRKGESTSNGFLGFQLCTTTPQPVIMEELEDTGNNYDSFGYYTSPVKQRVKINFSFGLIAVGLPLIGKGEVRIKVIKGGSNITLYKKSYKQASTFKTVSGDVSVTLGIGDQIWVEIVKNTNNSLFFAGLAVLSFEIDPIGTLSYDTAIQMSNTLPDQSQSNFFLDFLNQYGLITTCDTENRILHLIPFDEIEKNEPVDWSDKIDYSEDHEVTYRFEGYAQSNILTYKTDEIPDNGDLRGLITDGKAKVFTIDDENLEREITAYESEYYLPDNEPTFQGQVITVAPRIFNEKEAKATDKVTFKGFWNSTDSYVINAAVYRSGNYFICKVANTNTDPVTDLGVKWETVDESDIWDISDKPFLGLLQDSEEGVIVRFSSGNQTLTKFITNDTMDWEWIWNNHYRSFAKVIYRTKIVKRLLRLNYADINQLNFRRPIYIKEYGCLFYIDIIDQFKLNEVDSTYVTLVRL